MQFPGCQVRYYVNYLKGRRKWCRGGDLNPDELTLTTPSRWRVYQIPPPRHNPSAEGWQGGQGSNPRPAVLETAALPTELHPCAKRIICHYRNERKTRKNLLQKY